MQTHLHVCCATPVPPVLTHSSNRSTAHCIGVAPCAGQATIIVGGVSTTPLFVSSAVPADYHFSDFVTHPSTSLVKQFMQLAYRLKYQMARVTLSFVSRFFRQLHPLLAQVTGSSVDIILSWNEGFLPTAFPAVCPVSRLRLYALVASRCNEYYAREMILKSNRLQQNLRSSNERGYVAKQGDLCRLFSYVYIPRGLEMDTPLITAKKNVDERRSSTQGAEVEVKLSQGASIGDVHPAPRAFFKSRFFDAVVVCLVQPLIYSRA